MKHSPAPWRFDKQFIAQRDPVLVNGLPVSPDPLVAGRNLRDANNLWIGEAQGPHVGVPQENVLGNAVLMAAAPQLYNLLQTLLDNRHYPQRLEGVLDSVARLLTEMDEAAVGAPLEPAVAAGAAAAEAAAAA